VIRDYQKDPTELFYTPWRYDYSASVLGIAEKLPTPKVKVKEGVMTEAAADVAKFHKSFVADHIVTNEDDAQFFSLTRTSTTLLMIVLSQVLYIG